MELEKCVKENKPQWLPLFGRSIWNGIVVSTVIASLVRLIRLIVRLIYTWSKLNSRKHYRKAVNVFLRQKSYSSFIHFQDSVFTLLQHQTAGASESAQITKPTTLISEAVL